MQNRCSGWQNTLALGWIDGLAEHRDFQNLLWAGKIVFPLFVREGWIVDLAAGDMEELRPDWAL